MPIIGHHCSRLPPRAACSRPGQQLHSRTAYPVEELGDSRLRDGRRLTVRPARAADAQGIHDLFFRMSAEDVRTRFFRCLRSLPTKWPSTCAT